LTKKWALVENGNLKGASPTALPFNKTAFVACGLEDVLTLAVAVSSSSSL
jgi:hypothetical protein